MRDEVVTKAARAASEAASVKEEADDDDNDNDDEDDEAEPEPEEEKRSTRTSRRMAEKEAAVATPVEKRGRRGGRSESSSTRLRTTPTVPLTGSPPASRTRLGRR
jgi:hypothetical protein